MQSAQAATGGNFADAITAYQAAGAQAVAKLGPEMDAAGAANAGGPSSVVIMIDDDPGAK